MLAWRGTARTLLVCAMAWPVHGIRACSLPDQLLQGLTVPRTSDYGLYREELSRLKDQQSEWRKRHSELMEKKKRENGSRPCPSFLPIAVQGGARPTICSQGFGASAGDPGPSYSEGAMRGRQRQVGLLPPALGRSPWMSEGASSSRSLSPWPESPEAPGAGNLIDYMADAFSRWDSQSVSTQLPPATSKETPRSLRGTRELRQSRGVSEREGLGVDLPTLQTKAIVAPPPPCPGGPRASGRRTSNFDLCSRVARKFQKPIGMVRQQFENFAMWDVNGSGTLTENEFEAALRKLCSLPDHEKVPSYLFEQQWGLLDGEGRGYVGFEEFFLWAMNTAFSEEVNGGTKNPREHECRAIARKYGYNLMDIERLRGEECLGYSREDVGQVLPRGR